MVTLTAQAKVDYAGLLLSTAFEASHSAARPTFPSLSGASPPFTSPSLCPTLFLKLKYLSLPLTTCQAPVLLLQGWLQGPYSKKPVSLPREELITPTMLLLPRGDLEGS